MNDLDFLTIQEEEISNYITSIFYQDSADLDFEISKLLSTINTNRKEFVMNCILNRINFEKNRIVEYLAAMLRIENNSITEIEDFLLNKDESLFSNEEIKKQYHFFLNLYKNLKKYQINEWQKKNSVLFNFLINKSESEINTLNKELDVFIKEYLNSEPENIEYFMLHENLEKAIISLSLQNLFNRAETITRKIILSQFLLIVSKIILDSKIQKIDSKKTELLISSMTYKFSKMMEGWY